MPAKKEGKHGSVAKRSGPGKTATSAAKKQSTAAGAANATFAAGGSASAAVASSRQMFDLGRIWPKLAQKLEPIRVTCIRPDDLLVCDFVFTNLQVDTAQGAVPKLVRRNPSALATLVVEMPPQSFGEQAFLDATGTEVSKEPKDKEKFKESGTDVGAQDKNTFVADSDAELVPALPSAKIRMAGRSRLAFAMPAAETELDFTIDAILAACRRWPMRLDINAVPDPSLRMISVDTDPLVTLVGLANWKEAANGMMDALGGAQVIEKPLADAARRVATKAVEMIRSNVTHEMYGTLERAMNDEIDVLADRYVSFSDPSQRDIAVAALSLLATQAIATHRIGDAFIDLAGQLPFYSGVRASHEPAPDVTALEVPYRLILSPVPQSYWQHSSKPVVHNGRTELWHTRLTSAAGTTGPDEPSQVRALWSPDYAYDVADVVAFTNDNKPFRMSLDPLDRQMLVTLMSGLNKLSKDKRVFHPRTARAGRLTLSSLGALLDAEGSWPAPAPKGVGLEEWRHLATLGRDQYVRVVYRGVLCGLRHAASLVKVTERKFEFLKGTKHRVAVLRQKFFILPRERVKHYDGNGDGGRDFPFTDVEILTRVTPNLAAPDDPSCQVATDPDIYEEGIPHRACFWPMVHGADFQFQIAATDSSGARVTFAMPLLFVGAEANEAEDAKVMQRIIAAYNAEAADPRRRAGLGNAAVCFAPIKAGAEGDPRLPTGEMVFAADPLIGGSSIEAQFYPKVESAQVGIAAIQRLLQKPNATVGVRYPDIYKTTPGGFGPGNPGELFLKLEDQFPLAFGDQVKSDALGGLATPSMTILGLSRIMGPAAAQPRADKDTEKALDASILKNKFNPADFFQDAKILGGIDLKEILDLVPDLSGPSVPKLLSKQLPDKVEARFDWTTTITHGDSSKGMFVPNAGGATVLEMHGLVTAPIGDASATTFSATATIINFKVNLFGFVTLWFDRLQFKAKTGSKPDVAVDLHPGEGAVDFGGPLEFVDELRSIIPSNGFSDPPGIIVTPSGISASYSVNVPSISVGIFALEHLSLGAGFLLPFDAKPAEVRFNFAERQRPFSLTVSLLGGGGFFAIGIGSDGVREIEAALEFGAAVSIDLGIASGSVEIKAGVYFHWQTKSVELVGYVRLHGELSVLGLISASLTFNLQLGYLKENGRSVVWGEASLEVEIEVLFLSFSVSVKCRREFGGSEDPKFIALIPDQSTWTEYCAAFAAEAA